MPEAATSISFKVDGVQKTMTPCKVTIQPNNLTGFTELRLTSYVGKGDEGIYVSFIRPTMSNLTQYKPKTLYYFIGAANANLYQASTFDDGSFFPDTPGEAKFTTLTDDYVAGTFKFTGLIFSTIEKKEITEGKFSCKITK
ncbi:hypothetical protein GCM10027049_18470 [Mucilaginibacter puniceus]